MSFFNISKNGGLLKQTYLINSFPYNCSLGYATQYKICDIVPRFLARGLTMTHQVHKAFIENLTSQNDLLNPLHIDFTVACQSPALMKARLNP